MTLYLDIMATDPYVNLATEEYLLRSEKLAALDIFMLWQNTPTVVIGKHQNAYEEIDSQFTQLHNIHVVRRLTGGGAVYHDHGNLNFTFIKRSVCSQQCSMRDFANIIIGALAHLGLAPVFSGRNDLEIRGRKISGNAQYLSAYGLIHHGTLLIHSDFNKLVKCLRVNDQKYLSKGIKSVQSRVANIQEFVGHFVTVDAVKKILVNTISIEQPLTRFTLTESDMQQIEELANSRYRTWEWNYGVAPKYNFKQQMRFAGGHVGVYLQVEGGLITKCNIFGDFFAKREVEELAHRIKGVRHEEESLKKLFSYLNVEEYFDNISLDELVKVASPASH